MFELWIGELLSSVSAHSHAWRWRLKQILSLRRQYEKQINRSEKRSDVSWCASTTNALRSAPVWLSMQRVFIEHLVRVFHIHKLTTRRRTVTPCYYTPHRNKRSSHIQQSAPPSSGEEKYCKELISSASLLCFCVPFMNHEWMNKFYMNQKLSWRHLFFFTTSGKFHIFVCLLLKKKIFGIRYWVFSL